jgi:D-erythrulose 4-kinase
MPSIRAESGENFQMTRLTNDPANFMDEMLEGFCALYPHYVMPVAGGVVRSTETRRGKVAVVVGGGSGHYPAFCGVVGPGFADGAVVGNIFTSPSGEDAYSVGKAAMNEGGLLFITGNYAGDVLNFDQAKLRLIKEGYSVENFYVTDDVASASAAEIQKRRGIAGDFVVFKIASAASEKGLPLAEVLRLTKKANDLTRTLGVGFHGCTLPGAGEPLFTVPKGKMGLGLGIHGEPGISEDELPTAEHLAQILVDGALAELKDKPVKKIAVILNGLGGTKYEELFVVWRTVSQLLNSLGYEVVEPEVGEIVTSLDMAGCSLTITLLDDELEELWKEPCNTPAYKKGISSKLTPTGRHLDLAADLDNEIAEASPAAQINSGNALELFRAIKNLLINIETELGQIDAIAGDGDHGRGMVKGITAAEAAANKVVTAHGDISSVFKHAGNAWAAKAGGTSGALWGLGLRHAGALLEKNTEQITPTLIAEVIQESINAIQEAGKAKLGDKTMLDSMLPFAAALTEKIQNGENLSSAWKYASSVAKESAEATATLSPKIGRARPLATKSIGTPDAGAVSFARIVDALNTTISQLEN